MKPITSVDIEIAIMRYFDIRRNLIVPCITNWVAPIRFETDILILSKSGYATGFEIKTSKSDLLADKKKQQYRLFKSYFNGKTPLEYFYGSFKYFNYAVPGFMKDFALENIHDFCGLWVIDKQDYPYIDRFYCVREPRKLFNYKWSDKQMFEVARLGTMRILNLKEIINNHSK